MSAYELSRPMGRVWPDGEFCLWREHKREPGFDPDEATPLGLSRVANSHRAEIEGAHPGVRRGLKGITRRGQRLVRNSAWLLQQKYGKKRLSFLTCTLPGDPGFTFRCAESWAEIVRVFLQRLKRRLVRRGLSPAIVSVTEIQPKRFERDGGMPLHLHLVFHGAHRDCAWEFRPSELQEMWAGVVQGKVPEGIHLSWRASIRIEQIRDNAAGYLGKYMSKGEDDIQRIIQAAPGVVDALPHTWYNLSKEARDGVLSLVLYGPDIGEKLEGWIDDGFDPQLTPFDYVKLVKLVNSEGHEVKSFYTGELNYFGRRAAGCPCHEYEITVF